MRFFARDTKHDFLTNYRGVYINEDLTPLRAKLLQYVKWQDVVESQGRPSIFKGGPTEEAIESPRHERWRP